MTLMRHLRYISQFIASGKLGLYAKTSAIMVLLCGYADIPQTVKSTQPGNFGDRRSWMFPEKEFSTDACVIADDHQFLIEHAIVQRCKNLKIYGDARITVLNGGTLTVYGNVNLLGNASIKVEEGGLLRIIGNFMVTGNGSVVLDGNLSCSGYANIAGHGNICGKGEASIFGSISGDHWCAELALKPYRPFDLVVSDGSGSDVVLNFNGIANDVVRNVRIERSENGLSYTELGQVNITASDESKTYQFMDAAVSPGNHYYRISEVRPNAVVSPSEIVNVYVRPKTTTACNGGNATIVCNPTCDVNILNCQDGQMEVQFIDLYGNRVTEQLKMSDLSASNYDYHIDRENFLVPGIYMIKSPQQRPVDSKRVMYK